MYKICIQIARGLCLSNIYYVSQSVSRETHKNIVSRETNICTVDSSGDKQ